MKKIGIITINDYKNYGNRLQNYASQEVLKSLGYFPETIVNSQKKKEVIGNQTESLSSKLKKLTIRRVAGKINNKLKYNYVYKKKKSKYSQQKETNFKSFTNKYIRESQYTISEESYHEKLGEFDCFVVGSDQVWNPNYRSGSSIDFLTFAPAQKRVSYAASFGISNIPVEYSGLYTKWLADFSALSVREEAGAKIIKELTGREATVLIDPTLMLSKQEWINISSSPSNKPKGRYILTYFLGEKNKSVKEHLKKLSKKHNLKIYNLADLNDRESYIQSPSEFINLINDATLVVTDSFHGCVFSIILESPFIVYERNSGSTNSMNSRIETLLTKFSLRSRMAANCKEEHIFEMNYSDIKVTLEEEKQKALEFLGNSLP
ncbi:polysaccharide pyruvyl transferase family protein [Terribacillus sp. DMT04]|uniref:polysaccharide pyruvyl transferase family protein n=1 Tax=Terribacillus sp. DMT04 TaxID=2850441 RepID=UPI001C2C5BA6|nr:polysaccharide pyruvyl transferase family protein [Terribacillus sp. DMT04]QXE01061.1 polysaccharide pyruvyl transferase family protein [Terribacillus sp. DMT04]